MKGYTLVLCALLALGAYAKAETSVTTTITPEPAAALLLAAVAVLLLRRRHSAHPRA